MQMFISCVMSHVVNKEGYVRESKRVGRMGQVALDRLARGSFFCSSFSSSLYGGSQLTFEGFFFLGCFVMNNRLKDQVF